MLTFSFFLIFQTYGLDNLHLPIQVYRSNIFQSLHLSNRDQKVPKILKQDKN